MWFFFSLLNIMDIKNIIIFYVFLKLKHYIDCINAFLFLCVSCRCKPMFWYCVQRAGRFIQKKPNLHFWCCSTVWQISYARMVSSRVSSNTNNISTTYRMWNIVPILDEWCVYQTVSTFVCSNVIRLTKIRFDVICAAKHAFSFS